jgi:hypothetical protein
MVRRIENHETELTQRDTLLSLREIQTWPCHV